MAANQDDVYALLRLGQLYEEGRYIPQNQQEAVHFYRRAAELGNDEARTF